jgi:hypothetical protein
LFDSPSEMSSALFFLLVFVPWWFMAEVCAQVPHLTTSDGTARIPLIHHNSAADELESTEVIQDTALIVRVFVLSELVTCSILIKVGRRGTKSAIHCFLFAYLSVDYFYCLEFEMVLCA